MKKTLSVLAVVIALLWCVPAMACDPSVPGCIPNLPYIPCTNNLIVNGDFTDGNVGFYSDYVYAPPGSMYDPKTYVIGTNPQLYHSAWGIFCDHTGDAAGNMMIVNATCVTGTGCTETAPYDDIVWKQTVTVIPGTTYLFKYFVALSYGVSPPVLEVKINGEQVSLYDALTNPITPIGEWREVISQPWVANAETAEITMVDMRPMYNGDDYALDDIQLCATSTPPCLPKVLDLTAGQTMDVGSVTVWNDDVNLYIKYDLDDPDYPCAVFGELHAWVGTDLGLVPANPQGTPVPGQFCNAAGGACSFGGADGLQSYSFTIPLAQIGSDVIECGTNLYIVTHAEVNNMDCDSATEDGETAWGGGKTGPGPRWWFYGQYEICCGGYEPPPDPNCFKETAFAKCPKSSKGAPEDCYVWAKNPKFNPEEMLNLNFNTNRWGWAIKLFTPGTYYYPIYAGAAQNKIDKGTLVGTFTVVWDGSVANISYDLDTGYFLEEIHVYAADAKPTTAAPGRYGNLAEFDPISNAYLLEPIALVDAGPDGVWIIGHAVVTNGYCGP